MGARERIDASMRLSLPTFRPPAAAWNLPSLLRWQIPSIPRYRFSLRRPASEWILIGTFFLYTALSAYTYFAYVEPWIRGATAIRIGADSDRYWDAVIAARNGNGEALITLESNFLGPVLIGLLMGNGFVVFCFNSLLFVTAMKVAGSIQGVNKTVFGWLVLLNAELLPSLTTLNKEILALFAAVLTAKYLLAPRRSIALLGLTLVMSFLARWEQAVVLLLFLVLAHTALRTRPKLTLLLLVIGMSVGYPLVFSIFHVDPAIFDYLLQGANTIVRMNSIQAAGGFFLVVVPKIFMTMAGRLGQPWVYWSGDFLKDGLLDPQQEIFQPLGCLAFLGVFAYACLRRKLPLRRPIPMLIALTLIVSALPPFIQPRYLFAAYVLLCLVIARQPQESPGLVEPTRSV